MSATTKTTRKVAAAKGIEGINKWRANGAKVAGWHISTRTQYIGYVDNMSAEAWCLKHGAVVLGIGGNVLCVEV